MQQKQQQEHQTNANELKSEALLFVISANFRLKSIMPEEHLMKFYFCLNCMDVRTGSFRNNI